MRWSSTCPPGLCHLKACLSVEYPLPRWCTHMDSEFVPVSDRRPQFLPPCRLLEYCHNMAVEFPRQTDRQTEEEAAMHFELALEITYHLPQSVL